MDVSWKSLWQNSVTAVWLPFQKYGLSMTHMVESVATSHPGYKVVYVCWGTNESF